MKKEIITLAITAFITVTVLIICQTQSGKAIKSQDKIAQTKIELYQGLQDSLQQFNKESNAKIGMYEMSITEYKTRIANEKKLNANRSAKKLEDLNY